MNIHVSKRRPFRPSPFVFCLLLSLPLSSSLCLFVSLSFCLFVFLSLCLFVSLSLCLFVSLSFCLFVSLSFCLFVFLSLCLFVSLSFCLLVPLSPLLSFFNVHLTSSANSLKTKELRKRHFRLKILSQWKPLRIRTLGAKSDQSFAHFPADPTLHTRPKLTLHAPPRNPTPCRLSCRLFRPNPTHPTPLIIKL